MTSLIEWPGGRYDGVVRARHRLLDTGLFADDKLIELFDAHDPGDLLIYRMGEDHTKLDEFQYGNRGGLSAAELLQAVKDDQLWLNILDMPRHHDSYRELVDAIYAELESRIPGFRVLHTSANLLVSSPRAQVFYHADAPQNMLWHLRGRKRVWVYPGDERFAPREWVEKIFTRESDDDLPYDPEFDQYATPWELGPGDMLTWPQNVPHRVENIEGLCVSLTTEHYTPEAMKKRMTYLSNRYLRKWFGLPTTGTATDTPAAMLKITAFRIARRLPGFKEYRESGDTGKFTL